MDTPPPVPPNDPPASETLAPLFRVSIAFLVVTTFFLVLRFFSVFFLRTKRLALSWDDFLLFPAWLCNIAVCITSLMLYHYETKSPATAHTVFVDPTVTLPAAKIIYADTQFQAAGYALTRLSILALYDRLFIGRKTRLVTYAMIAFVLGQWIAYGMAGAFLCWPVEYYWNRVLGPAGGTGVCGDENLFFRATTPPNIASDVILIAIPLPTIWRLQTTRFRKIALTTLFFSTVIALVGSCVRQWMFSENDALIIAPYITDNIVTWIVIEPSLYFIVACLPGMYPLFIKLVPSSWEAGRRRGEPRTPMLSPALMMRHQMHANKGFQQLVDTDFRGVFGFEATGAQAKEEVRASVVQQQTPLPVPMDDLRLMSDGASVLMTTEVSVTQEQKFEDLIGLAI